jgi:chaperonin GroEL
MQSKIAEIEIGGNSDAEKGEIRDIIVDSLNSGKSAMQNGMLPGGGVALYQAAKLLEKGLPHLVSDEYEAEGVAVMSHALKKHIKIIIENKIAKSSGNIINKIDEADNFFSGFDAKNGKVYIQLITLYRKNS